jgi:DNA-binding transcriptional regulator PaaX
MRLVRAKLLALSTIRHPSGSGDKLRLFLGNTTKSDDFEDYVKADRATADRRFKDVLSLEDNEILAAGRAFLSDWRQAAVVDRVRRKAASEKAVLRLVRSLQKLARQP